MPILRSFLGAVQDGAWHNHSCRTFCPRWGSIREAKAERRPFSSAHFHQIGEFLRLIRKMVLRPVLSPRNFDSHMTSPKLTLATAKCGDRLRVRHICPDCPHCVRLREMGFHDRTVLRKIADGAAVICVLLGTRVAVGRELCDHVEVERLAA
jgi:Fe2+ transport system protein FeoA